MRFKAEVNFDGREVARAHVDRLNLESLLVVRLPIKECGVGEPREHHRHPELGS